MDEGQDELALSKGELGTQQRPQIVCREGGVELRLLHMRSVEQLITMATALFACQKLFDPQADLASVALAAGFADQSHFTRVFKQMTGMTPGAFRAAIVK